MTKKGHEDNLTRVFKSDKAKSLSEDLYLGSRVLIMSALLKLVFCMDWNDKNCLLFCVN